MWFCFVMSLAMTIWWRWRALYMGFAWRNCCGHSVRRQQVLHLVLLSQSIAISFWWAWRVLYIGCAWRICCWPSVWEVGGSPCGLALACLAITVWWRWYLLWVVVPEDTLLNLCEGGNSCLRSNWCWLFMSLQGFYLPIYTITFSNFFLGMI